MFISITGEMLATSCYSKKKFKFISKGTTAQLPPLLMLIFTHILQTMQFYLEQALLQMQFKGKQIFQINFAFTVFV